MPYANILSDYFSYGLTFDSSSSQHVLKDAFAVRVLVSWHVYHSHDNLVLLTEETQWAIYICSLHEKCLMLISKPPLLTWVNNHIPSQMRDKIIYPSPKYISNHIPSEMRDGIIYPSPNFSGCNTEVWEWINYFITHFIIDVITLPCWDKVNPCK